jgi:hypothetical protein
MSHNTSVIKELIKKIKLASQTWKLNKSLEKIYTNV